MPVIKNIIRYECIDSTNEEALRLLKSGVQGGTLIIAKEQKRGRGRFGREWHSKKGQIAISLLLSYEKHSDILGFLSIIGALSIQRALSKFSIEAFIKWPNDIVLMSKKDKTNLPYCGPFKKVSGVLVENSFQGAYVKSILGIGINLIKDESLEKVLAHVTNLSEYNSNIDPEALISVLINELNELLKEPINKPLIIEEYRRACVSISQKIVIKNNQENINGIAIDINENGYLIINDGNKNHCIKSGEIDINS